VAKKPEELNLPEVRSKIYSEKIDSVCSHCSWSPFRFVPGEGPRKASILLIGECPAEHEIREGRPFVGNAGSILDSILDAVDLDRSQLFITNSVKCSSGDPKAKPSRDCVARCRYYLQCEIAAVKPKMIIALGNYALQALTGKQGITAHRGEVRWYEQGDFRCKLVPTFHPQFIGYDPGKLPLVLSDFMKAIEESQTIEIKERKMAPFIVLEDCDQVVEYLEETLLKSEKWSFDFETTGLDRWRDKPVCLGLSHDGIIGYVLPILNEEGESVWKRSEWRQISQAVHRLTWEHEGRRIGLNIKFDTAFLIRAFKIKKQNWRYEDVGVAHHLLNCELPHDLDTLSELYTEFGNYKSVFAPWKRKVLKCPRQEILYPYNATDAVATYQLDTRAISLLKKDSQLWKLYKSEMTTLYNLFHVEKKGILVNPDQFGEVDAELQKEIAKIKKEIFRILKKKDFNPASPDQVSDLLFKELKIRSDKRTKIGNKLSTDAEVLEKLASKHPVIPQLLEFRKVSKLWSTYIKGFRRHIDANLRVHADFRAEGTKTGRIVCRNPNLLNIPNEGGAASIRKLFVAPPGYKLIYADASQVELRILAHLSGDKAMLRCYIEGKDLHSEAASAMFAVSFDQITKEQRRIGKIFNFGVSYGSKGASLEKLGFSRDQIAVFTHNYFKRFRGLYRYIQQVPIEAETQGYLRTVFGRIRQFLSATGEMTREQQRRALNFPAQSTAAEEVRLAFNKICQELRKHKSRACPVNTVYDSIMIESPDEEVAWIKTMMKEKLERPIPELGGAIFPINVGVGQSWAEAEANTE